MNEQNPLNEINERLKNLETLVADHAIRIAVMERNKDLEISFPYRQPVAEQPPPQSPSEQITLSATLPVIESTLSPETEPVELPKYNLDEQPRYTPIPQKPAVNSSVGSLESSIGGTWFHRIGMLAIILSIGYFLREAARRGWILPLGRVAIGALAGITLLTLGDRLRHRGYKLYSQSLSGGGIAILYLVVYASYSRYNLAGHTTAFAIMSLVTAISVYLSARHDAISMSILALLGGFLTPIILSTGRDNQVALFTYIAILDAGVLITAYFKRWRVINFLVFAATILMVASWIHVWYDQAKLAPTIVFITLFFIIFAALAIFHNIVNKQKSDVPDLILLTLNAFLYFSTSYDLLDFNYHKWMGLFAVSLSVFYLVLGYITHKINSDDRYLSYSFTAIAVTFLTLAVPIQLDQHWTTIAWALEGTALCWIGIKADSKTTRDISIFVFLVALGHWLAIDLPQFGYKYGYPFSPIINKRGISALFLIGSLFYASRLCTKRNDLKGGEETAGYFTSMGSILALVWLTADLNSYFSKLMSNRQGNDYELIEDVRDISMTLLWSLFALVAMITGAVHRIKVLRIAAMILLSVTLTKVLIFDMFDLFFFDSARYMPLLNRFAMDNAILICLLGYLIHVYYENEAVSKFERNILPIIMTIVAHVLATLALTFEVIQIFESRKLAEAVNTQIEELRFAQNMALSILWGLYGSALLIWGLWRNKPFIRYMSFVLLLITTFKVFVIDMSSLETIYRVISFMVLGIILVAASFLYQRQFGKQNES